MWSNIHNSRRCLERCRNTWQWLVSCHDWWPHTICYRCQSVNKILWHRMTMPVHYRSGGLCVYIFAELIDIFIQNIRALLNDPRTTDLDALRLVALYALRYESHANNATTSLVDLLSARPKMNNCKSVSRNLTSIFYLKWNVSALVFKLLIDGMALQQGWKII